MMRVKKESMQVKAGLFVIAGLVVLVAIIFLLGSEKKLFDNHYELTCRFENISGLREGAPVQLAGIKVGTVQEIRFDDSLEEKKIKILLSISSKYSSRIRRDSKAKVETQGLLGDKMIFISVGSADTPELKSGEELKTKAAAGFNELVSQGEGLLENFLMISDHVEDILGEVRDGKGVAHSLIYDDSTNLMHDIQVLSRNLNQMSAHLESISKKIERGDGTLGALVNDASLFNDVKTLMGKANRNKLIKAVIRHTLNTKDEKLLKN